MLCLQQKDCGLGFSYVEANHVIRTEEHSWVQESDPQIMVGWLHVSFSYCHWNTNFVKLG